MTARKVSRGRAKQRQPARSSHAVVHQHGAATRRILARLRKICLALPDADERVSHGEPTWFAGAGKVFASLDDHHHGASHLSVWLPATLDVQEALVAAEPARYFRPPYVGHRGWIGVVLDAEPDWKLVAALVEDAYRRVASRRLVARLDAPS